MEGANDGSGGTTDTNGTNGANSGNGDNRIVGAGSVGGGDNGANPKRGRGRPAGNSGGNSNGGTTGGSGNAALKSGGGSGGDTLPAFGGGDSGGDAGASERAGSAGVERVDAPGAGAEGRVSNAGNSENLLKPEVVALPKRGAGRPKAKGKVTTDSISRSVAACFRLAENMAGPVWAVEKSEIALIAEPLTDVINEFAPSIVADTMNKYGCVIALATGMAAVIGPRVAAQAQLNAEGETSGNSITPTGATTASERAAGIGLPKYAP